MKVVTGSVEAGATGVTVGAGMPYSAGQAWDDSSASDVSNHYVIEAAGSTATIAIHALEGGIQ